MLFKKLLVLCVFVSMAAFLVACGGDDDDDGGGGSTSGGSDNDEAIEVRMVDFGYEPRSITVRANQPVAIELENDGAQPHTFTIANVVDSQRVEAGQSKPIAFSPAQTGTFTFFCTIHGQASMSGTLTVN
ncbi:MAG TPA: cupredoxin domain-containing protein [Dehalococcoidia bacterium]|jgi:plastocyanin|nr:cupredoxin domain-containing protein [Dehalococcoidia bacterium]